MAKRFVSITAFALVALLFGASDAAAQTTDCKACGISCNPYYCIANCIRMSYTDCRYYSSLRCAGLCYTYYDHSTGSYECKTNPDYYPCYA